MLRYHLKWGATEQDLLDVAWERRIAPPDPIMNAPELLQGLAGYFQAFSELSTCRAMGFGSQGPIPWMAIDAYARVNEYEGDDRAELEYLIRALDSEYLDWQAKEAEK